LRRFRSAVLLRPHLIIAGRLLPNPGPIAWSRLP
jgi:hypothetical protein